MGGLAEAPLNSPTAPQCWAPFTRDTFGLAASGAQAEASDCPDLSPGSIACHCVAFGKLTHHPEPQLPHLPNG